MLVVVCRHRRDQRRPQQRIAHLSEIGVRTVETRVHPERDREPATVTDQLISFPELKQTGTDQIAARRQHLVDGPHLLPDQEGDRPRNGPRRLEHRIGEVEHLLETRRTGAQADDLRGHVARGDIEGLQQHLDIGGQRLRPRRLLGGRVQHRNQIRTSGKKATLELGRIVAGAVVGADRRSDALGDPQVQAVRPLVQPQQNLPRRPHRQVGPPEHARQIARNQAALDIRHHGARRSDQRRRTLDAGLQPGSKLGHESGKARMDRAGYPCILRRAPANRTGHTSQGDGGT